MNAAVTLAFAYISSTQVVAVPLQLPPQPAKVCVASFQLVVRVTGTPLVCVVVPGGLMLPPSPAITVSVYVGSRAAGVVGVAEASLRQLGRLSQSIW